jgi:glutamate synthase (NADPH/NADH) small chain
MTYGIAAYKITPEFCEEELEYILSIGGIDIQYEQELGRNLSLAALQAEYDAVYLAFGVGLARRLDIPGEELTGVVDAIRFIYDIRSKEYPEVPVGDKVAVIGLGMTAIDAATQAKRLGAKEVTIVYRRTHAEMPCTQAELDIAQLDGCQIRWLAAPKAVLGNGGQVTGLVCSLMHLGEPDASGRRMPLDSGETITLEVDMVIKAAGQIPFTQLVQEAGLGHDKGKIVTSDGGVTGVNKIFAGGDCVNGGKEVVDAVQAGKDAAAAILTYIDQGNS